MIKSYPWMEDAACRSLTKEEKDTYLFPEGQHTKATKAFIAELCGDCPVKEKCFDLAIRAKIGPGCPTHIYGGLDYSERMKSVRQRVFAHIERKRFSDGSFV
jgi:hypothetical protein